MIMKYISNHKESCIFWGMQTKLTVKIFFHLIRRTKNQTDKKTSLQNTAQTRFLEIFSSVGFHIPIIFQFFPTRLASILQAVVPVPAGLPGPLHPNSSPGRSAEVFLPQPTLQLCHHSVWGLNSPSVQMGPKAHLQGTSWSSSLSYVPLHLLYLMACHTEMAPKRVPEAVSKALLSHGPSLCVNSTHSKQNLGIFPNTSFPAQLTEI